MKLYATITGDRGKPAHKGSNKDIRIEVTANKRLIGTLLFYSMGQTDLVDWHTIKWITPDGRQEVLGTYDIDNLP